MKKLIVLIVLIELLLIGVFLLSPDQVSAQNGEQTSEPVELTNPLGFINITHPREVVEVGFRGFSAVIGAIAIAFVVFNAFKLVVATSEESRTEAKQGLTWSVGGFLIAILSFTIISGAAGLVGFSNPGEIGENSEELKNPLIITGGDPNSFVDVMNFVMMNFLGLLGFATMLMIIYYGYRYITARGNEEATAEAKEGLKWAAIGFILAILAFTIIIGVRQLFPFGPT